ncbi:MAG: nucleotidyltransferase domain-containing protein [Candidatus Micrarchaeota archaeon]
MLFDETVKWKILVRFFEEPEKELYVKELARKLKISPGSASSMCRELEKEHILRSEEKGRALFYSLRNDEPFVRRLKSAWFLDVLMGFRGCWENGEIQSAALYGSRASGEFISKSDVDILLISNADKKELEKGVERMRKRFGEGLTLTIFSIAEWRGMRKERFYTEVLSNHVLLHGSPLVVG